MAHRISKFWFPVIAVLAVVLTATNGHSFLADPQQRGLLDGHFQAPYLKKVPGTKKCHDYSAHFPSGNKGRAPGAGQDSQDRAVRQQGGKWSEYKPMDRKMYWRSGVCGDEYGKKQEHMLGGKYYCNAHLVRTYKQGQVIDVKVTMVAHHNGYMELHVCDVAKCGGEISVKCFHQGHCQQLRRAANPTCDKGFNKNCGPIDRKNPGRWYFPCDDGKENVSQLFGGKFAKFKLPDNLHCDHCVLQWFHTAAAICNPPGVIDYFDGPDAPKSWGKCKGQGGAIGGVTRVQKPCAPGRTPEEYLQCADIRITPRRGGPNVPAKPKSKPRPAHRPAHRPNLKRNPRPWKAPYRPPRNRGAFVHFVLYGKARSWKLIRIIRVNDEVNIRPYSKIAVKVTTSRWVKNVRFYEDGRGKWTDWRKNYFMYGNNRHGPFGWKNPPLNRRFTLTARSPDGSVYSIKLRLNK